MNDVEICEGVDGLVWSLMCGIVWIGKGQEP